MRFSQQLQTTSHVILFIYSQQHHHHFHQHHHPRQKHIITQVWIITSAANQITADELLTSFTLLTHSQLFPALHIFKVNPFHLSWWVFAGESSSSSSSPASSSTSWKRGKGSVCGSVTRHINPLLHHTAILASAYHLHSFHRNMLGATWCANCFYLQKWP